MYPWQKVLKQVELLRYFQLQAQQARSNREIKWRLFNKGFSCKMGDDKIAITAHFQGYRRNPWLIRSPQIPVEYAQKTDNRNCEN